MGQMATGILYGCEAPKALDIGEAVYDLVERWEKANKITWRDKGQRVRVEVEGDKVLLGVWVAVGGSGEDGIPYFLDQCVPLAEVWATFKDAVDRAAKLWKRFHNFVGKEEKVRLPEPILWLTPCETA